MELVHKFKEIANQSGKDLQKLGFICQITEISSKISKFELVFFSLRSNFLKAFSEYTEFADTLSSDSEFVEMLVDFVGRGISLNYVVIKLLVHIAFSERGRTQLVAMDASTVVICVLKRADHETTMACVEFLYTLTDISKKSDMPHFCRG